MNYQDPTVIVAQIEAAIALSHAGSSSEQIERFIKIYKDIADVVKENYDQGPAAISSTAH